MKKRNKAVLYAVLAAALYAINIPLSKLLLEHVKETMMAAFLYLGAGIGLMICSGIQAMLSKDHLSEPLTKKQLPYTVSMVLLDILAPILLMMGISRTSSANVSLLNNFEIVATSVVALVIFKEAISKKLWFSIMLVTIASMILGFEGVDSFAFNEGSVFVLGACICWGVENNCTKMISHKSSSEIVMIKGCFSGLGSLIVALFLNEGFPEMKYIAAVMLLGFVAYGLSINFYIKAQKDLGAAKTSAYYSIAPFLGAAFGMFFLKESVNLQFYLALVLMIAAAILMAKDSIVLQHAHEHEHTHTHEHRHGNIVHTHEHTHVHSHIHVHEGNEEEHTHHHDDIEGHHHSHHQLIAEK